MNHHSSPSVQKESSTSKPVSNKNEESLAALRAALSNIPTPTASTKPVFETKKVFKPISGSNPVPQPPQPSVSEPKKSEQNIEPKQVQEVPEDVLKKVLETE